LGTLVDFSGALDEIGSGRWTESAGVASLLAGSWDCPVAGTAIPVAGTRPSSSRKGACWEVSCC
jgi:hypothetical protein